MDPHPHQRLLKEFAPEMDQYIITTFIATENDVKEFGSGYVNKWEGIGLDLNHK